MKIDARNQRVTRTAPEARTVRRSRGRDLERRAGSRALPGNRRVTVSAAFCGFVTDAG